MERRRFIALLALGTSSVPPLFAADQTDAEKTKRPVQARVVDVVENKSDFDRTVGNIEITYQDGTKDRWTTKRDCGLPQVAADGTVGWVIYQPAVNGPQGEKEVRINQTVIICRKGKVLCRAASALPFIEQWHFLKDGKRFVTKSRAMHGLAEVELFDTATGKRLSRTNAEDMKLPDWAEGLLD